MGKVTGFLEYDRQEQKYQLAGERVRHFREFTLPLDDNDLKKQAGRCMDCGVPFCHGPTGCPVHNQIPDWNDLVWQGDWEEARATSTPPTIFRNSPAAPARLPARRPAPSTSKGSRSPSRRSSRPSPTRPGRWVGLPEPPEVLTGRRVAVIGSGPAGWRRRNSSPASATRSTSSSAT
jgi:glutamate synthase (NADPH/NADH) small chain